MRPSPTAPRFLATAALLGVLAIPAAAQEGGGAASPPPAPAAAPARPGPLPERPISFLAGMGFDAGGEQLVKLTLTDGSTQTLSANQGVYFDAGLSFAKLPLGESHLETAATIGIKGWDASAADGSIRYLAFPFEVLERISWKQVRFGAGVSILLAPRISSTGVLSGNDADLKNSLGIAFQGDWIGVRQPGKLGFFLGGRFVWQKLEGDRLQPVSANALGLRLGIEY